jgi:hypothetical protein
MQKAQTPRMPAKWLQTVLHPHNHSRHGKLTHTTSLTKLILKNNENENYHL